MKGRLDLVEVEDRKIVASQSIEASQNTLKGEIAGRGERRHLSTSMNSRVSPSRAVNPKFFSAQGGERLLQFSLNSSLIGLKLPTGKPLTPVFNQRP